MNILILLVVEGDRATFGPCRLQQLHRAAFTSPTAANAVSTAVAVDDWNSPV